MAGRLRQRAVLAPARHAAVDQSRIARRAHRRAEPEALHDARAIAFDERIGRGHEVQRLRHALGRLQVERDDLLARAQRVVGGAAQSLHGAGLRTCDHGDLGAQRSQDAPGHRARADALELDDADALQRPLKRRGGGRLFVHLKLPFSHDL
ncbi:hypothetical protein D3C86_1561770 [compost metagenome]